MIQGRSGGQAKVPGPRRAPEPWFNQKSGGTIGKILRRVNHLMVTELTLTWMSGSGSAGLATGLVLRRIT